MYQVFEGCSCKYMFVGTKNQSKLQNPHNPKILFKNIFSVENTPQLLNK